MLDAETKADAEAKPDQKPLNETRGSSMKDSTVVAEAEAQKDANVFDPNAPSGTDQPA